MVMVVLFCFVFVFLLFRGNDGDSNLKIPNAGLI